MNSAGPSHGLDRFPEIPVRSPESSVKDKDDLPELGAPFTAFQDEVVGLQRVSYDVPLRHRSTAHL